MIRDTLNRHLAALGLRFANPDDERKFRAEHATAMLPRQRVLTGFALVSFLVFAVRDIAGGPTFGWAAFYWRVFFILPLLGLTFVLTFSQAVRPQFERIFVTIFATVIAATGVLSLLYPPYGATDPAQATRTMTTMMLIIAVTCVAGIRFAHAVPLALAAVVFWILGSFAKALSADLYPTMFLNVLTCLFLGGAAAYWLERAAREAFAARRDRDAELARRQDALFATLPRHVVDRVARGERPIAEAFVEAVVVLADLAGFNTLSKRIGPKRTVELLDDLFTEFDALAEKHQLQRLRTVGDSYCVVGGTFEGLKGSASEAAQMALDMVKAVERVAKRFDLPVAVRVGVHVGPLIGGVVGRTTPIYDFWGDTFNVVSELQLMAEGGQILCSENFYWRAGRAWAFEPHSTRELPGIGKLQTFCLCGVAPAVVEVTDGA